MAKISFSPASFACGMVTGGFATLVPIVSFMAGSRIGDHAEMMAVSASRHMFHLGHIRAFSFPEFVGWISSAALGSMSAWAIYARPTGPSPRIDGIASLAVRNRRAFPFVSAIPSNRVLQTPTEWLLEQVGALPEQPAGDEEFTIKVDRALGQQLTGPWHGFASEPPHRRALLALFALQALQGKSDGYTKLRDRLATAAQEAATNGTDVKAAIGTVALPLARDFPSQVFNSWLSEIARRHYWSETVCMSSLAAARSQGMLPETEFGWLMQADRPLALALNSVGRPSFLTEALGAACHWHEEVKAGRALSKPAVQAGVRGIMADLRQWESLPS